MKTHFPTVPVDSAKQHALPLPPEPFRPLLLLVDDEPVITETLAAILRGSGLAVLTAGSGMEALEIAHVIPPELLITDIAMPGIGGVELALAICRMVPDCEIVLFSGQANTPDLAGALHSTGRGCVTMVKPVHPTELLDRVFELLGRRGTANRPPTAPRAQSLYDFLLSMERHEIDVQLPRLNVTMRHRLRPTDTLA